MTQKAQIISQDFGVHNSDLAITRGRLLAEATYKSQRVIMLVPALGAIPPKVYLAHRSLIFPPNQGMYPMLCVGMEVGDAYSQAIESVLAHPDLSKWEYLLTVESDNIPPPDGVLKLIESMDKHPELSCIGGLYFCKGPGGCAHIWGDIKDPIVNYRPQVPEIDKVQECYGTSMGFNLWRMSMFHDKRIARPLFQTKASAQGVGTQDLAFWGEARKYGYRCAVDTRVRVGHYDYEGKFGQADMAW